MSESHIKSQIKLKEKGHRKISGILRSLAKSDSSVTNKLQITVYKDDTSVEKKPIIIAPSMFMKCQKIKHNSTINTNVNIIQDLTNEKENSSPIPSELVDYPDSSDFDDED